MGISILIFFILNWMFPNYEYEDPSPPSEVASDHLHIKDARCTQKMIGVKFHITSHHSVQKGRFWHSKIQLSSKVAKFAGKIEIDLALSCCIHDFFLCVILSFRDMIDFIYPANLATF